MIKEICDMEMRGEITFTNWVVLPTGIVKILSQEKRHNIIVDGGKAHIVNRLKDASIPTQINYIALGNKAYASLTAPVHANTTLEQESVRVAITTVASTTTGGVYKMVYSTTFTASQINTTTEIALYSGTSSANNGTMITRAIYTAINIPTGTSMGVDYTLFMSNSAVLTGFTSGNYSDTFQTPLVYANQLAIGVSEDNGTDGTYPIGYAPKTTELLCHGTANTYYQSATALFIHPSDGTIGTKQFLVRFGG